jgi:transcriptional regulator with XRE-family HTH domain
MVNRTISGKQALAWRRTLGVSQAKFWKRLGVTQSGGSRYECGRTIPRTVHLLMQLAYSPNPGKVFNQVHYRRRRR